MRPRVDLVGFVGPPRLSLGAYLHPSTFPHGSCCTQEPDGVGRSWRRADTDARSGQVPIEIRLACWRASTRSCLTFQEPPDRCSFEWIRHPHARAPRADVYL